MKFNFATTRPINPPSASPVLTKEQVFAGLKIKARDPVKFIPMIAACEVVKEDDAGLTRVISLKPGAGMPGKVTEVVTFVANVRADFVMTETGTAISNIVSVGEDETDLYLTFTFAWNIPELAEGTEEAAAKAKAMTQVARQAVPDTIEQIRLLVKDGTIA